MKKNKKKIKILIFVLVAIFLLFASGFLVFKYLSSRDPFKDKQNRAVVSVGIFDDGTYYISKADNNIKFSVKNNKKDSYTLTNQDGKKVDSEIVKKGGKYYIKPLEKYESGKTYILELNDNKFTDKVFSDGNKIEFKIKEKEKADYKFSDSVKKEESDNIKVLSDNKIEIKNNKYKENQIILATDGKDTVNAYKVKEVNGDTLTVDVPEVADIYEKLDLYEEGKVNFDNLEVNKDLENNIKKEVKKSNLFKFLAEDVYADVYVDPKINLEISGSKIKIEIELVFKANGEKKMGIEALKRHDLVLRYSYELLADYGAKVDKNFAINFDLAIADTKSYEIELKCGDEYLKGIEDISDKEYSKSIQEIVKKLQKEVPDVSENSIDIGAVEIPTSIYGVNVFFDIYFQCQLSVQVNFDYKYTSSTVEHVGFIMNKNEKRAYQNITQDNSSHEFSVTGKEEIRVGIGIDAGVSFINKDLASASVGIEFGAYQEAFSTFKMKYESTNNKINTNLVAKIELGIYLKAKVSANVNVLLFKAEAKLDLKEIKVPVFTYGNSEILSGIEPSSSVLIIEDNNKVKIPTINKNFLDLDTDKTRSEKCDLKDIKFEDADGNKLDFDGTYVDVKKNEEMKIYAVYEDNWNRYKSEIIILKKGSTIKTNSSNSSNSGISNNKVGSLSINSNNPVISAYKKYILDKKYIEDYKSYFKESGLSSSIYNVGYSIYDINKDGVPEMIIDGSLDANSSEWVVDMIYTYSNNKVVTVSKLYNYGGIRYDSKEYEVVYTEIRPTYVTGGYGFYKLVNTKLVHSKTVGHDRGSFVNGVYEYDNHFIYYSNGNQKNITESEEQNYYNNVIRFSYQNINNVK